MRHHRTIATSTAARATARDHGRTDGRRLSSLTGLLALALSVTARVVTAHGGGLDRYGCHSDRDAGTYHCHVGRFAGRVFSSKDAMLHEFSATP